MESLGFSNNFGSFPKFVNTAPESSTAPQMVPTLHYLIRDCFSRGHLHYVRLDIDCDVSDLISLAREIKGIDDEKPLVIENWATAMKRRGVQGYSIEDRRLVEEVSNKIEYIIIK